MLSPTVKAHFGECTKEGIAKEGAWRDGVAILVDNVFAE